MRKLQLLLLLIFPLIVNAQNLLNKLNVDSIKDLAGEVYYPIPDLEYKGKSYTISGVVINESGRPLPFTTIKVNGKVSGSTDLKGNFRLSFKDNKPAEVSIQNYKEYFSFGNTYEYNCLTFVVEKKYNDKTFIIKLSLTRKLNTTINPNLTIHKVDTTIRAGKPAIYLYPETKQEITITHHLKGEIHTLYPDYNIPDGWKVIADSNGLIYNPTDKRNYTYLFWEGICSLNKEHFDYKSGFYVDKSDYTSFLLDKLDKVGLNETEINDFIVYWLPILNKYEKVFIHFWVNDNIDGSSILHVTPKPDTMIRLFMEFREHKGEALLPEQELPRTERNKLTLVEWGGGEIGSDEVR